MNKSGNEFNKGLAPSFNVASRSEAAIQFKLRIEPQPKLNMEPAALEAGDILPKLYKKSSVLAGLLLFIEFFCILCAVFSVESEI